MGLGSTAKKIQTVAETAEQLYEQIVELQQRIVNLEQSVDETTDRVRDLEVESEKQMVLLRAMARKQGMNVDEILANAAIEEVDVEEAAEGQGSGAGEAADSAEAEATSGAGDAAGGGAQSE